MSSDDSDELLRIEENLSKTKNSDRWIDFSPSFVFDHRLFYFWLQTFDPKLLLVFVGTHHVQVSDRRFVVNLTN